jgi:hypothetical protein
LERSAISTVWGLIYNSENEGQAAVNGKVNVLTLNDQLTAAAKAANRADWEEIRRELERILAQPDISNCGSTEKKFLRYVVEQTGRASQIKEFSIRSGVLERGSLFDPRIDNIVRVQARKLRIRLARYYETEGAKSSIRILLPPRGYVPVFQECIGVDQTGTAVAKAAMPAEPEEAVSNVPSTHEATIGPLPSHTSWPIIPSPPWGHCSS